MQSNYLQMTPIERAARALCKLEGNPENTMLEGRPMWANYLPQVLAVVDALHEPSLQMQEGGAEILRSLNPAHSEFVAEDDAANVWRFMIDALGKGPL